jgi:hypothetical protein
MSITLNNQIHGSTYARQGEHTLILRSDIKILLVISATLGGI